MIRLKKERPPTLQCGCVSAKGDPPVMGTPPADSTFCMRCRAPQERIWRSTSTRCMQAAALLDGRNARRPGATERFGHSSVLSSFAAGGGWGVWGRRIGRGRWCPPSPPTLQRVTTTAVTLSSWTADARGKHYGTAPRSHCQGNGGCSRWTVTTRRPAIRKTGSRRGHQFGSQIVAAADAALPRPHVRVGVG